MNTLKFVPLKFVSTAKYWEEHPHECSDFGGVIHLAPWFFTRKKLTCWHHNMCANYDGNRCFDILEYKQKG